MSGPAAPVALRLADGRRADRALSAGAHVELFTAVVHGAGGGLVEVVGARRDPEGRLGGFRRHRRENFLAADARAAVRRRALALDRAGMEVFATPAKLARAEPGDAAVGELAVVWVDIDASEGVARLRRFAHRPHLVCWSGGGGGAHAYWRLSSPVPPAEGERANRMLAGALGADLASTNRGRLMRLPGTRHRKSGERWCRVASADLALAPYDPAVLVAGLCDPRAPRSRPAQVGHRRGPDRELDAVSPPAYFAAIARIEVGAAGGFVGCPRPAHEDRHPSCFVYPDPGSGWHCYACLAGGSAIDLASAVAGGPTGYELRGEAFRAARRRALRSLGLAEESNAGGSR